MTSAATTGALRGRVALVTAVIAALAIAAPVGGASAAASVPQATAIGPTLIGDTFNGGATIVTSPEAASGTTVGPR